jgi:hypothetical protein
MKIALRAAANGMLVCADDTLGGQYQPSRALQANRDQAVPGGWETFDLLMQDETGAWVPFAFPAPTPTPTPEPPSADTWPPPPGVYPPMPPNIQTVDVEECLERVRWHLWDANSNDDESYWMNVIVLNPEEGHTPGWTADSYWGDWIHRGEGVGKGYVWPPR